MWTPQMVVPVSPNPQGLELAQAAYRAYALGWSVSDYRGQQIVAHGGGVPGMVVVLAIVPGKGRRVRGIPQQRGDERARRRCSTTCSTITSG